MNNMERVFDELRALRKQLDGAVKFSALPQAMPYKRAAYELGIGLTELKEMVKLGAIVSVAYGNGKRPKIPLEEIRRLTALPQRPVERPRGKPSRQRKLPPITEDSSEATRDALRKL